MRIRVVLTVLAVLVVGGVVGGAAMLVTQQAAPGHAVASPVSGRSPDYPTSPTTSEPPPAADIDYPALTTPRHFSTRTVTNGYQAWVYPYPKGWQAYCITDSGEEKLPEGGDDSECTEVRYRPADEPVIGGYSLRVKAIANHRTPEQELAVRLASIQNSPDITDVKIIQQTQNALYLTLRTSGNLLRYNFFAWYAAPGSEQATLEMSVAGRSADNLGLNGLFAVFAERLAAVE